MEKLNRAVVIALNEKSMNELTSGAAGIAGEVILICPHTVESPSNAAKAYRLCGGESAVQLIPTIVKLCKELAPVVILLDCSKNSRLIAAHAAAEFETAAQVDVSELRVEGGRVITKRMVFGGAAFNEERSAETAVVCVGAGTFSASDSLEPAAAEEISAEPPAGVTLVERREKEASGCDLGAAKLVVGVGRGASEESDLELCKAFAAKLGAELGCTRPVAEEKQWLPKERYIGVSGAMLKPETYIAVGISGQIQHVVGISSAGTIIAVDKNEAAPIFKYCDYGIVGDLRKIIPALTALIG